MSDAEQEASLGAAVDEFRRIGIFIAAQLENGKFEAPGPTQNLVGRLAIAVVRQAEGIAALYQAGPYYAGQIGQLLRGLLEMWRTGAWLVQPDTVRGRNQRAVGLWVQSLAEERKTLELQTEMTELTIPPGRWDELDRQDSLVEKASAELLDGSKPKQTGGARNDYQALGRPDRYIAFRRESEISHVGAIALGQMVAYQTDTHVHLGGKSSLDDRARKLVIAQDAMSDVTDMVVVELDLDAEEWSALKLSTYERFEHLLGPIIGVEEEE